MESVVSQKINWKLVARKASRKYGRVLHPAYCRSVWSGNNNSKKVYELLSEIINASHNSDGLSKKRKKCK